MRQLTAARKTGVAFAEAALCFIWSRVYRRWLWNDFTKEYDKVIKVIGWRTARIENKWESRRMITPCFTILGVKFE